jgi:hypothetical protein
MVNAAVQIGHFVHGFDSLLTKREQRQANEHGRENRYEQSGLHGVVAAI